MLEKASLRTFLMVSLFLSIILCATASAEIIYVDVNAPGPLHDGTSWEKAYKNLQDALNRPPTADDQIHVARGIYRPDINSIEPLGSGNRGVSFELVNGVTLKGGYAGNNWPNPDLRRHDIFTTVLSGDLGQNDAQLTDPCDLLNHASRAENSYHVLFANDVNAVLDGFTICSGNANSVFPDCNGGGLYSVDSNTTVKDCIFSGCSASSMGGAIYDEFVYRCDPTVFCSNTFAENSAGYGGAVACCTPSTQCAVVQENCEFSRNYATNSGGAIYDYNSISRITNCTFGYNIADANGGGIYNKNSNPFITNSIFWGNTDSGGNDESAQIHGGTPFVAYSCIQGLNIFAGNGNIGDDPLFVDSDSSARDFHLRSQVGTWNRNEGIFYQYAEHSPAIDAGEPEGDIGQETFPNGGIVNMGAYGGTAEASKTYFGTTPCETIVAGDINGDCIVNFLDFAFMARHWLVDNQY
jgi:hypothetical protein